MEKKKSGNKRSGNKRSVAFILEKSKGQTVNIIVSSLLYAFSAFLSIYNATVAKKIIDSAVSGDRNGVVFFIGVFLAIILSTALLRMILKRLEFIINNRINISFREHLFKSITRKEFSEISKFHSGDLLNRFSSDISVIAASVTNLLPSIAYVTAKLIGIFVVLFSINKMFTLAFLLCGIIIYVVMVILKKRIKSIHKKVQETEGDTTSFMQESVLNLLVIRVFGAENNMLKRMESFQSKNYTERKKRNTFTIIANTSFTLVFSLAYLIGLVWGSFGILEGTVTFGTLTLIITLVGQIQTPVGLISGFLPQYYNAAASAERILEIDDLPDEREVNDKNLNAAVTYDKLQAIMLKDVSFSYGREEVLRNTSVSIKKGDFSSISGISGIGKSTFLKLLLGVYAPTKGEIYFELKDLQKLTPDKYTRRLFAYVPQGNMIISGTIKDNMTIVNPDATLEEIAAAAKISCAYDFINALPDKFNTKVGEKGYGLSEGQIQRIAITRAILSGAPILIFDEATSALDEATEESLLKNIKKLKDKTCIIVSHKKAAENICNRHFIIEDASIVEI